MNLTFQKLRSQKLIITLSLVFLFSIQTASAAPFIGSTSSTTTEACGECMCTWVITTTYFFWIKTGTKRELTETDCSGII